MIAFAAGGSRLLYVSVFFELVLFPSDISGSCISKDGTLRLRGERPEAFIILSRRLKRFFFQSFAIRKKITSVLNFTSKHRPSDRRAPGTEFPRAQCAFEISMFMCPAVHMSTRSLLRSSSIHEPSDPPFRVLQVFKYFM